MTSSSSSRPPRSPHPRNRRSTRRNSRHSSYRGKGGRNRYAKKAKPLTWWQKILSFLGLYKANKDKKELKKNRKPSTNVRDVSKKSASYPVETNHLYLGNLSYDATEHDLEELFKGVGTVRNVSIIYNRHTHSSKGYAFLEMLNVQEAKRAVEVLHDQPFMGRKMVVNGASPRSAKRD